MNTKFFVIIFVFIIFIFVIILVLVVFFILIFTIFIVVIVIVVGMFRFLSRLLRIQLRMSTFSISFYRSGGLFLGFIDFNISLIGLWKKQRWIFKITIVFQQLSLLCFVFIREIVIMIRCILVDENTACEFSRG